MSPMTRIANFEKYSLDKKLIESYISFEAVTNNINESSFLDKIKNTMSRGLLGSLSYIKMADDVSKRIVDLEKEKIDIIYKLDDEVESIDDKILSARRNQSDSSIKSLQSRREKKIDEIQAFEEAQDLKIKEGKDILSKIESKGSRRSDYVKSKKSEIKLEIAQYKYEVAKKRSNDRDELDKLKNEIIKAEKKAKESAQKFGEKIDSAENWNKSNIPEIKSDSEKKILRTRSGSDIIERKKELEIHIANVRSQLERDLQNLADYIDDNGKNDKDYISSKKADLLDLSNNLDASINLLETYRSLGKTKESIEKSLGKESEFTRIANDINNSISDGSDSDSGTTKIITSMFNSLTKERVSSTINKIFTK